jgi:hypothetical protein
VPPPLLLLLQAANTRAPALINAPIATPLLILLTRWTSSVLAQRWAGLPTTKVTPTLPFVEDRGWDLPENCCIGVIFPGHGLGMKTSPDHGPLHFCVWPPLEETVRRARAPIAGTRRVGHQPRRVGPEAAGGSRPRAMTGPEAQAANQDAAPASPDRALPDRALASPDMGTDLGIGTSPPTRTSPGTRTSPPM